MPEPGYNPNAVSSYYNPNKSSSPKLRPAGLGTRPSSSSRADRKGESAVFSAPKPVYSSNDNDNNNNSKVDTPVTPASTMYSAAADSLMSAGGGGSLSSPSSKRIRPMTLYEQRNMQEMKTELEDYLRGVAIEGAIESDMADMAVPEVYTGETDDVTVKAGDTLTAIAKDKGVSLQELIDANPQITNPDMIRPGETVTMPSAVTKEIITKPSRSLTKEERTVISDMSSFEDMEKRKSLIASVFKAEGGYSTDKNDTGNYYNGNFVGTNHGISAPVLAEKLGRAPTVKDMKALTVDVASEIAAEKYIDRFNIEELPDDVQEIVLHATFMGETRGVRALQNLLGLTPDGLMGPNTKSAMKNSTFTKQEYRDAFLEELEFGTQGFSKPSATWNKHGRGWTNRYNKLAK
jgi:LysM repeat protein